MTTFKDGPAQGQTLMLRRSPKFLRVVNNPGHKHAWDALDMPEDVPAGREIPMVYMREVVKGTAHVSTRPRSGSGWYPIAEYGYHHTQPTVAEMKDLERWRAWVAAQPEAEAE